MSDGERTMLEHMAAGQIISAIEERRKERIASGPQRSGHGKVISCSPAGKAMIIKTPAGQNAWNRLDMQSEMSLRRMGSFTLTR